jgi:hypothetical protein
MFKYVKEQRSALGIPTELSFVIRIGFHYTVGCESIEEPKDVLTEKVSVHTRL